MLNVRQEKFCLEYVKCGNATDAAILAGYAEKYAGQNADKLLKNTNIQCKIRELREQMESEKIADAKEVMEYLTSVMRGQSESQIVVVEGSMGTSKARKMMKNPDEKEKLKAADSLAKILGISREKIDVTASQVVLVDEVPDDW